MTRWQVTRLDKSLGTHATAWDALNQRLFSGHPMLSSSFIEGLLKHFGDGTEHLCVLAPHGAPEAMCILKARGPAVWGTFLPSQAQISPVLVQKLASVTGLISSLPGFVARLDFLCNDPQFGDLATRAYATTTRMDHALTMNVNLKDGFQAYWGSRTKNLTKNIARYERRLTGDNIARKFSCITAQQDIGAAVARYAALESKGWKSTRGTAIGTDNVQGLFYTELLSRLSASGGAMVCELWFNGQLVASRLMVISKRMAIILKTTYDETFRQYAPGRLLLRDVIEAMCHSHPDKCLEFYTDATPDQLAWATGQRWITHWSFYRNRFSADLYSMLGAARIALKGSSTTPPGANDNAEVFQYPDQLPSDVQQLFEDSRQDNFQGSLTWYQNLADTVYPKDAGVHIHVLRREGRPVAALPVVTAQGKLGWHLKSLGNFYTSFYAPATAPELKYRDFARLISAILHAHAPVASLRFEPMDPDSTHYSRLWNALRANGLVTFGFFGFGNWYLTGVSNWQNYVQGRDRQLRSTIRNKARKFAAAGGTLELIQNGARLEPGLAAYEQVYALSWKRPEPYPAFMPGLIRTSAEHGWLRLGIAWINGTPIAAQVWIVVNGKANIYKLAYDENYKAYGSGTVLSAMLMEHVIEKDGVSEVDYLTGDDPYKKSWMSHRRERWGIIAYNPKSISGFFGIAKEVIEKLLKPLANRINKVRLEA